MPKMKTRKAVAARFKATGTGKLMRNKQGKRHLLTRKPNKRKRQARNSVLVATTHEAKYKQLMGA